MEPAWHQGFDGDIIPGKVLSGEAILALGTCIVDLNDEFRMKLFC